MNKQRPISRSIERAILALPRLRMRRASRRKLSAALTALDQVSTAATKVAKHGTAEALHLYEVSKFFIVYVADLTVLTRDMACHPDWWASRLYARLLAMTMLEFVEDVPQVLGKRFRESLKAVAPADVHSKRVSGITKQLSDFRKKHETLLRQIRRISAAHRDHDANLLLSVIEEININSLVKMATELQDLQTDFSGAMADVFQSIDVVREVMKRFSVDRPSL